VWHTALHWCRGGNTRNGNSRAEQFDVLRRRDSRHRLGRTTRSVPFCVLSLRRHAVHGASWASETEWLPGSLRPRCRASRRAFHRTVLLVLHAHTLHGVCYDAYGDMRILRSTGAPRVLRKRPATSARVAREVPPALSFQMPFFCQKNNNDDDDVVTCPRGACSI
jgi:hypothetical protein